MRAAETIDATARARGQADSVRLAELETVMDAAPAAILVTRDRDCAHVAGNAAAYAMFGRPQGSNLSLSAPDGTPGASFGMWRNGRRLALEDLPLRRALLGDAVRDCEIELRFADGTLRYVLSNATPLRGDDGKIYGAVAVFLDISERKRLGDAQEHLASIVEHSDDAIVSKDLNGIILSWNKGAERLFGYKAEEAVGKPVTILIPDERIDEEPHILSSIRSGKRIDHYETVRRRKDGSLVEISLTVSPMRNGRGEIVAASKIARDISQRKEAEVQRSLLAAELNHRVKNTLATVIAIARQSFAGVDVAEARAAFNSRIQGLARSHERLADANWQSVPLRTLLEDGLMPYCQGDCHNIALAGPDIPLQPKCALTLGLALHELATNAAKYGALSSDGGRISVDWHLDADGALVIAWRERGGPEVTPPVRSGFGRLLLERALVSDLGSQVHLEFAREGLSCTIRIPAAHCRAAA